MTTGPSYKRVYERVKATIPDWNALLDMSVSELKTLIADAGLSGQRATRLKLIAARLMQDFGKVSLDQLLDYDDESAQRYLTSLPGVGIKSAKCVLMYSLDRKVLPVDTHTARIAHRLGLVSTCNAIGADEQLSAVIPANLRFDFHVNAVAHGRAICRARSPRCNDCVLSSICPAGSTLSR